MLSAQLILTGSIGESLGKKMVTMRMIATETGEILAASSATVEHKQLQEFHKELMSERTQLSASLFRSLLAPGWGQFYTNHPVHGTIFSISGAASLGVFVWTAVDWNNHSNTVIANRTRLLSTNPETDTRLRLQAIEKRDEAMHRFAVTGIITGGVWVLNLVDAAVLGAAQKRRVRDLYFSAVPERNGAAVTISF